MKNTMIGCVCFLLACCVASFSHPLEAATDNKQINLSEEITPKPGEAIKATKDGLVEIFSTVLNPRDVSDIFGKRIATRFIAIQVTVANNNPEYQYLIHGITIDVTMAIQAAQKQIRLLAKEKSAGTEKNADNTQALEQIILDLQSYEGGGNVYRMSSVDLKLLRGVAEKGSYLDKRNIIIRFLRGAGTIAGGIIGVASFGPSYAPSVAVFNGPFITAVESTFPDYTVNQINRLNDTAYGANTLVPRQQAKVMVVFTPQPFFLNKEGQKKFWDDPSSVKEMFNVFAASIAVDGTFIQELEGLPPLGGYARLLNSQDFQFTGTAIKGFVSGGGLKGANVSFAENPPVKGLQIEVTGDEATDAYLPFIIKHGSPVKPGLSLDLLVTNNSGNQKLSCPADYIPVAPVINEIHLKNGVKDKIAELVIQGKGLIPGYTVFLFPGNQKITQEGELSLVDGEMRLKLKIEGEQETVTLVASNRIGGVSESKSVSLIAQPPISPPSQ